MKPSQRYRLNRLAERLVTPERFDPRHNFMLPIAHDDPHAHDEVPWSHWDSMPQDWYIHAGHARTRTASR